MSYTGSVLEAFAKVIAARAKLRVLLAPDADHQSTEPAIIWTQPKEGRYRYEPPRFQPAAGDATKDRYLAVEVLIRAPGSERRLLDMSDAHLVALDHELGDDAPGGNWRTEGRSDGGGEDTSAGAWEERFTMLLKYQTLREKYLPGPVLDIVTNGIDPVLGLSSGVEVDGPGAGQNAEKVL